MCILCIEWHTILQWKESGMDVARIWIHRIDKWGERSRILKSTYCRIPFTWGSKTDKSGLQWQKPTPYILRILLDRGWLGRRINYFSSDRNSAPWSGCYLPWYMHMLKYIYKLQIITSFCKVVCVCVCVWAVKRKPGTLANNWPCT